MLWSARTVYYSFSRPDTYCCYHWLAGIAIRNWGIILVFVDCLGYISPNWDYPGKSRKSGHPSWGRGGDFVSTPYWCAISTWQVIGQSVVGIGEGSGLFSSVAFQLERGELRDLKFVRKCLFWKLNRKMLFFFKGVFSLDSYHLSPHFTKKMPVPYGNLLWIQNGLFVNSVAITVTTWFARNNNNSDHTKVVILLLLWLFTISWKGDFTFLCKEVEEAEATIMLSTAILQFIFMIYTTLQTSD